MSLLRGARRFWRRLETLGQLLALGFEIPFPRFFRNACIFKDVLVDTLGEIFQLHLRSTVIAWFVRLPGLGGRCAVGARAAATAIPATSRRTSRRKLRSRRDIAG